jgi:hypothetical protein
MTNRSSPHEHGLKKGDTTGRPIALSSLLEVPIAKFFEEISNRPQGTETGPDKKNEEGLVETDAADGNPHRTRIPTAAWKAQTAFHSSHKPSNRPLPINEKKDRPLGGLPIRHPAPG